MEQGQTIEDRDTLEERGVVEVGVSCCYKNSEPAENFLVNKADHQVLLQPYSPYTEPALFAVELRNKHCRLLDIHIDLQAN
jgi:hypothetical protein